jgi:protein required for attachment to host cells
MMADPSMKQTAVEQVRHNPSPLTTGTWVLVADSEKALLMENIGDADAPNLVVRREDHHENPPNREQGTDKPGRFNDGPSVHRSAVGDTDWHQLEKARFAVDLAEMLYRRAHRDGFQRLIVVAAPEILGLLRPALHQVVTDRIVAEADLNITNLPINEMERRITAAITPA